ncbi:MAG: ATP-binding protein [Candidatus Coatesbacteria bacterium]
MPSASIPPTVASRPSRRWVAAASALLVVGACTAVDAVLYPHMDLANLVMVYLLGVLLLAYFQGTGASVLASFLSVVMFDFCFVPPRFTLAIASAQHLFTFAVMLLVALSIGQLTAWVRAQAEEARARERRTAELYALSRELATTRGTDDLLGAALKHISAHLESAAVALLPDAKGKLCVRCGDASEFSLSPRETALAQWAYDFGQLTGRGTAIVPDAEALYVPLPASGETVGALAVKPLVAGRLLSPEQIDLLEALAHQTALAVASDRLTDENQRIRVREENERIRSSLLSSVSHDLRTPLAAITGSATALLQEDGGLDAAARRDLLENIRDEADRLSRLVGNLIEMTRLEAGPVDLHTELHHLEDVVGSALARMEERLRGRPLVTALPADLPMVPMDALLMEQVLVNLVDNALKYTPAATPVEVVAEAGNGRLTVRVSDRGPGIPPEDLDRLFDKFYRGRLHGPAGGAGLGLAICKAVVEAHGGAIWAANRAGGGAVFQFFLPAEAPPP